MGNDTLQELLERIEALGRENVQLKRIQQERNEAAQELRERERYYRQLFETNGLVKLLVHADTGLIMDANPVATAYYGYSLDALKRLHLSDLEMSANPFVIRQPVTDSGRQYRSRHRLASGEVRDVEVTRSSLQADGTSLDYLVVYDVTEHDREMRVLRRTERRFRQFVEAAADLIYQTDHRGYFQYINAATLRLLGYTREEMRGMHFTDLLRPDHIHSVHTFYIAQALRRVPNTYHEFPVLTRDRREVWIGQNVQLLRDARRLLGFQAIARDITERKRAEQPLADHLGTLYRRNRRLKNRLSRLQHVNLSLEDQVLTDYLTGLQNHRAFQDHLEQALQYAYRTETPLSVLLIDLDAFKQINDTRGHPAGDAVLAALGKLLLERVRSTDFVARYGGEEFAVILPHTDREGAVAQAERFRLQIEQAFLANGNITASFGVASLTPETRDRQQLILQADAALYAAKQAGRNCVRHYTNLSSDTRATVLAVVTRRGRITEER